MKTNYVYKNGLPNKPSSEFFSAELESDDLVLQQIEVKLLGNKVLQTYKIPLGNIIDCGLVSETEITSAGKGVVGRGLVGGFLLGPAGMVLGGMSGMGNKKQKITLFVISYVSASAPGEAKSFVLDTKWANHDLANVTFANKAQKAAAKYPKSQMVKDLLNANAVGAKNADGSITL